jgi:hypothetical protein
VNHPAGFIKRCALLVAVGLFASTVMRFSQAMEIQQPTQTMWGLDTQLIFVALSIALA